MPDKRLTGVTSKIKAQLSKKARTLDIGQASELLEAPKLWVSTGSLALDRILRGKNPGGIPVGPRYGKMVHVAGDPSTGKSLIADHVFRNIQKVGGIAMVAETEASRDPHFADIIGLDWEDLVVIKTPSGSIESVFDGLIDAHEAARKAFGKDIPIVQCIDSLDSMEAAKTVTKDFESSSQAFGGGKPQAIGAGLKRYTNMICGQFPTTLLILNQVRVNPNVMYGEKRYTPGGLAPHFYSSVEILLSKGTQGEIRGKRTTKISEKKRKELGLPAADKGPVIGRWVRAVIGKNKLADTFREEAQFFISFTKGVSAFQGLLSRMACEGQVSFKGDTIFFDGETFSSEKEWIAYVRDNPKLLTVPASKTFNLDSEEDEEEEDE